MTTTANEPYVRAAWQGALDDFAQAAGPGNINDPLFRLACALLEIAHAAPDLYSEADAEREACGAARMLGHDESSIVSTWRSAERTTRGKARSIPDPPAHAAPAGGFAGLAAYAASRGVPAEVFERAGWSDAELYEYPNAKGGKSLTDEERLTADRRRALRFETDAGPRWRLIDADKPAPKYWHPYKTHEDHNKAWYKLAEAVALAAQRGYLALVNGEASVVVAQSFGVPALCETGGGERETPPQLLQLLRALWQGPVVIALDCDKKGQTAAGKKAAQYRAAGYADVRAIDLNLGAREDVADFCRLHGQGAAQALLACADLPGTAPPGAVPPRTQSQVIIDHLKTLGYTFRLNICTDAVECNGQPLTDALLARIRTRLRDDGRKQFGAVEDAYMAHAADNAYHPVRDYLTGLTWDGRPRIAELAACLVSDAPDVVYSDGARCTLSSVYVHRFLIGAVAKALDGRQQGMLVLLGMQRLGKSTFARWLCPLALGDYFIESPIDLSDKDSRVRLMSKFIWEVSELDATTRKADVAQLKHFITQQRVTVRRAYARFDTERPALASLVGTVNSDSFLADETGNRRFYILSLTRIDRAYEALDQDQVWAEAVHRYRAGEPWELLPEEQAAQAERNRAYYAETPLHDYVRRYFYVTRDPAHRMTAADIIDELRRREVPVSLTDHQIAIQLNRVAASLGLERVRDATGRYYVGLIPKL